LARPSATPAERVVRIAADQEGERLDVLVARLAGISRAQAQRLVAGGRVTQGGVARLKPGERTRAGESFSVTLPAPVSATPQPERLPLLIYYEDPHMIVVDKPAGMPVHPGPGHSSRTLVNALLAHCPDLPGIGGVQRPGIVHRLDKDTSGLIVAAKDDRTHIGLTTQLKERKVSKTYLALVEGHLSPAEAMIDAPIGRDPNNRRRMMVRGAGGRDAQTRYRVREEYPGYTLVEASPITGRTHQIRVHFASLGHPVAGDAVYGRPSKLVGRQFLHAWRLAFRHPISGEELSFEAPLPEELEAALAFLKGY
jgi:23S rRNA pseudouridine1911/1915/1917 synthase